MYAEFELHLQLRRKCTAGVEIHVDARRRRAARVFGGRRLIRRSGIDPRRRIEIGELAGQRIVHPRVARQRARQLQLRGPGIQLRAPHMNPAGVDVGLQLQPVHGVGQGQRKLLRIGLQPDRQRTAQAGRFQPGMQGVQIELPGFEAEFSAAARLCALQLACAAQHGVLQQADLDLRQLLDVRIQARAQLCRHQRQAIPIQRTRCGVVQRDRAAYRECIAVGRRFRPQIGVQRQVRAGRAGAEQFRIDVGGGNLRAQQRLQRERRHFELGLAVQLVAAGIQLHRQRRQRARPVGIEPVAFVAVAAGQFGAASYRERRAAIQPQLRRRLAVRGIDVFQHQLMLHAIGGGVQAQLADLDMAGAAAQVQLFQRQLLQLECQRQAQILRHRGRRRRRGRRQLQLQPAQPHMVDGQRQRRATQAPAAVETVQAQLQVALAIAQVAQLHSVRQRAAGVGTRQAPVHGPGAELPQQAAAGFRMHGQQQRAQPAARAAAPGRRRAIAPAGGGVRRAAVRRDEGRRKLSCNSQMNE